MLQGDALEIATATREGKSRGLCVTFLPACLISDTAWNWKAGRYVCLTIMWKWHTSGLDLCAAVLESYHVICASQQEGPRLEMHRDQIFEELSLRNAKINRIWSIMERWLSWFVSLWAKSFSFSDVADVSGGSDSRMYPSNVDGDNSDISTRALPTTTPTLINDDEIDLC